MTMIRLLSANSGTNDRTAVPSEPKYEKNANTMKDWTVFNQS